MDEELAKLMADIDWQVRAKGRRGRSKPGRPSKNGFFAMLQHVKMRPAGWSMMTDDEKRKWRNRRKAKRRAR